MRHERSSVLWFVFLSVGLTAGCQSGPRVQKASAARMVTPVLAILRSPPVRRAITNSFESRRRTLDLFLGRNGRNRELQEPPPADEPTSDPRHAH